MFIESKRIPKWSDKNLYELIQKVVSQELSSPRVVNLVEDTTKNVNYFYNEFYEKYATLKKTVSRHVVDKNASSIVLNAEHTVGTEKMRNRFAEVKKYVMEFGFHRLEYEIIEASRTPQGMVDLMYRKRVTSGKYSMNSSAHFNRWIFQLVLQDFKIFGMVGVTRKIFTTMWIRSACVIPLKRYITKSTA